MKGSSWLQSVHARGQLLLSQPSAREAATREEVVLRKSMFVALAAAVMLSSMYAQSFTAPAAGSLGYDVYDVVVNNLLGGPIGFVGGIVLIVWGATLVMKQWLITVLCVISGTVIIKAQSIVTSLGALVH